MRHIILNVLGLLFFGMLTACAAPSFGCRTVGGSDDLGGECGALVHTQWT